MLYGQCKEFNSLPTSGGVLDQDPNILDDFGIISSQIAKVEKRKDKEQETQMKRSQGHRRAR